MSPPSATWQSDSTLLALSLITNFSTSSIKTQNGDTLVSIRNKSLRSPRTPSSQIFKIDKDGLPVNEFGMAGSINISALFPGAGVQALKEDSSGAVYAAGLFAMSGPEKNTAFVIKLTPNGDHLTIAGTLFDGAISLQNFKGFMARLDVSGEFTEFGINGVLTAMKAGSQVMDVQFVDGRFYVLMESGSDSSNGLWRVNANGTWGGVLRRFSTHYYPAILRMTDEENYYVVGEIWKVRSTDIYRIANGKLDPAFGCNGLVQTELINSQYGSGLNAFINDQSIKIIGDTNGDFVSAVRLSSSETCR